MSYKLTPKAVAKLNLATPRKGMFYEVVVSGNRVSTSLYKRVLGIFKKRIHTTNVRLTLAQGNDPEYIKRAAVQGAASITERYLRAHGLEKTQQAIKNGDLF